MGRSDDWLKEEGEERKNSTDSQHPGFTEILSPQPWAKDDIRHKGKGAADGIVPEMETGPRADSGGSLCTSGGGSSGAEPRH